MRLAAEAISVAARSTLNYMCHVTIFIGSSPLRTVDAGLCDYSTCNATLTISIIRAVI